MTKTLEFIFDFGSPNAYLAYKALPPILDRAGASLSITPCLLGGIFKETGNQAPMVAFGGIKNKLAYEQREMDRFIATHGLGDFTFNPHFPVNTLVLMRGAVSASHRNELIPYVEAGLAAMWEDGKKMDDPETFVAVMNAAGLDGNEILRQTQDPDIKMELATNTGLAVERGAFGVPTFFVGDEIFFGKDRLDQVEAELKR